MLWIGAIFGALFGWVGILVAALFWATLSICKFIWAVIVFGFQAMLWVGALIYKGIAYFANRQSISTKTAPPEPTPKPSISAPMPGDRHSSERASPSNII